MESAQGQDLLRPSAAVKRLYLSEERGLLVKIWSNRSVTRAAKYFLEGVQSSGLIQTATDSFIHRRGLERAVSHFGIVFINIKFGVDVGSRSFSAML